MQIDRAQFLAFTALLSAGCGAGRDIKQVTIVDLPPPPAIDAGRSGPIPDSVVATPAHGWDGERYPPDEGYPADEDMKFGTVARAACGQSSRQFNAAKTGCADTIGKPLNCKPAVRSAGADAEFAAEKCAGYARAMLPGVARRAQACLATLGGAPDGCAVYRCGYDALMDACVTPKATAACKRLKLPATECADYLSGLNDKGLQSVENCAKKAGATPTREDLYSCVESL